MDKIELKRARRELEIFVEPYRELIGRSERMHWCRMYISGLLLDGERKSIEPIAKRLPGGDVQSLQQFVNQSPWEYKPVMKKLREEMIKKYGSSEGVLILDDTALPKKGKKSVGVAHQWCGALGKVANCQNLVTWHYSVPSGHHFPISGEIYLPREWTQDKRRIEEAGVPRERHRYISKLHLALKLLDEFGKDIPHRAIVWDAWYGKDRPFRRELEQRGEKYVGGIPCSHLFWPLDIPVKRRPNWTGRPRKYTLTKDPQAKAISAKNWGKRISSWETVRFDKEKVVQAKAIRVRETDRRHSHKVGAPSWLIIEKEPSGRMKYYVSNLLEDTSLKELVYLAHQHWMVEQGYQHLKEELGLDHFEGRSWYGLHHHLTLCFMAYDFLLSTKRHFKKGALLYPRFDNGSMRSLPPVNVLDAAYGSNHNIVHSSTEFKELGNVLYI